MNSQPKHILNTLYVLVYCRMKKIVDGDGFIARKDALKMLKYNPVIPESCREPILREMVLLGLLDRVNSQRFRLGKSDVAEKVYEKAEIQKMMGFQRKKWFRDS